MSFELIYTSAPRGIKAGTRGYCTVAFTEGMPANYVQLAESLSGYQKPEGTPVSPVAYSHYRFVVGGQRLSVLSRVTTATYADYTGRCPTIAHHVLVEHMSAQPDGNPAGVMADPSMFVTEWHDEPRLIRKVKQLPPLPAASFAARRWEQACGDAGWAGVLAQSAHETTPKPVYIIFNPDRLDPLPLLAESLNLLPPDMRWTITFNTFFTSLPHGTTCLWRCCLPDSPALREMRATPGTLCIDLTKPLGRASSNGPLVESARTGTAPSWPQRNAMAFIPPPSSPTDSATTSRKRTINASRQQERDSVKPNAGILMPNVGHLPAPPAPAGRKEKKMGPIIVASVSVTAVIMLAALLLMRTQIFPPSPPPPEPSRARQPMTVPDQTIPKEPLPPPVPPVIPTSEPVKLPASKPEPVKPPEPTPVSPLMPVTEPITPEPKPEPVKPPVDMPPQWQLHIISVFNQPSLEVPVGDPDCSKHQHDFYFKANHPSPERKKPSAISGKQDTDIVIYKINAVDLNIEISATKIVFSGTTNSADYPVSMRINRKKSEGGIIIWLQTLELNRPFIQTSSGYDISVSHPALSACLFVQNWPTDSRPWKENCRIRFKNSTHELKDIPFEITSDGGDTRKISLRLDKAQKDGIIESLRDEIATKRKSLKNGKSDMEYVRCVVKEYQTRATKPGFSGKDSIEKCLMDLAQIILEQKNAELQKKINEFGSESKSKSKTIPNLKAEISKEWGNKFDEPQLDLSKMINELDINKIPAEEEKKKAAEKEVNAKAPKSRTPKDKEKIDKPDKKIKEYGELKTRISKLMNLTKLQESYDLMKQSLTTGSSKFFDLTLKDEDHGVFKAFEKDDFIEIVRSEAFKKLTSDEPAPDNMLMIVEIYSQENDVLLSLIQTDDKATGDLK